MNKSTMIINHLSTDRLTEIIINESKYIVFTLMHRNLIVIDVTNKDNPILLLNRNFPNRNSLSNEFDKIIINASKISNEEDFISSLDTYIDLNEVCNKTTDELLSIYKIITEDYNL